MSLFGNEDQALSIVLQLKDDASKALDAFNTKLASVDKAMQPAIKASQAFAVGLTGIGVGILAFGTVAVKSAMEAQAAIAGMDATLKAAGATGNDVRDKILKASDAFVKLGFDDEAAAQSMAIFYQRTKDVNEAMKLSALAADLARAKHIDLDAATKLVNATLSGNGKALLQYGISIKDSATPLEALGELQKAVGGQAKAFSQTLAGQMEVAKNSWDNFTQAIGDRFLPVLTKVLEQANHFINDVLPEWITKTEEIIGWLDKHRIVLYAVAGALVGALIPAIYALVAAFYALVAAFYAGIPAFIAAAVALSPFILGGAVIAGIIAGIVWLVKNWDMVSAKAREIWGGIADYLSGVWNTITAGASAAWSKITAFFSTVWEAIKEVFKFALALIVGLIVEGFNLMGIDIVQVFTDLSNALSEFWNALQIVFTVGLAAIQAVWTVVWTAISTKFTEMWNTVRTAATAGWQWLVDNFKKFADPISKAWSSLWQGLSASVTSAWDAVKKGVVDSINYIIDKINVLINAINNVAKKGAGTIGVSVPSIPTVPRLAAGGIVTSPTLAMIGENGPEAIVPLSRGGGMGGSVVNITIGSVRSDSDIREIEKIIDRYFRPVMINHKVA